MTFQKLAEIFASHFGQSLEMMSGEKTAHTVEAVPAGALEPELVFWEQPFGSSGVVVWVGGAEQGWIDLGGQLLKSAGIEEIDPATAKSTFLETLNQAFAGMGRELTAIAGREIAPSAGHGSGAGPADHPWCRVEIESGEIRTSLLVAFSKEAETLVAPAAPPSDEPLALEVAEPKKVSGTLEGSRTLELLLDVELPVSVSFGRAQLPLKDVIKLTSGSIVELNRTVGEPVEIIVNNCVIARGEVVVVEGNFGVRIQQVISKQERLRTLY